MSAAQATRSDVPPAKKQVSAAQGSVDAFIQTAHGFAQPILEYIRALVHEAAPDVEETIKWSRPFFAVNGTLVCYMAAFTKHCSLGFWSPEVTALLKSEGVDEPGSSGSVGRITSVRDLPARGDLLRLLRLAADKARKGDGATPMARGKRTSARAPIPVPPELLVALAQSPAAAEYFDKLSESCRREYLDWITSAKRPETRERRITETVVKLAAGERYNAQYRSK